MDINSFNNQLVEFLRTQFNRSKPSKIEVWYQQVIHQYYDLASYANQSIVLPEIDFKYRYITVPLILRLNNEKYYLWETASFILENNILRLGYYGSRKKKSAKSISKFLTNNNEIVRNLAREIVGGKQPIVTKEFQDFDHFTGPKDIIKELEHLYPEKFNYRFSGKNLRCTNKNYEIYIKVNYTEAKKSLFLKNFEQLIQYLPEIDLQDRFYVTSRLRFNCGDGIQYSYWHLYNKSNYWTWSPNLNPYSYNLGKLIKRLKINLTEIEKLPKKIIEEEAVIQFYLKHELSFLTLASLFPRYELQIRELCRLGTAFFYFTDPKGNYTSIKVNRDTLEDDLKQLIQQFQQAPQ